MKKLKNWDNKTWLSSKSYISQFNKFLKTKINFDKNLKILDIGCGRANIISALQKKYKFKNKPVGIDVVSNRDIKKNIVFKKIDAIQYLEKSKNYDLIIIKQSIHFFTNKNINFLLSLIKKRLSPGGKLLIFSLKTKKNKIPVFKKMNILLKRSLKKDEFIFKLINRNLKNIEKSFFDFKVKISSKKYSKMIKDRFISCLLKLTNKEIEIGADEIEKKYNNQIKFTDTLICLKFTKK